jgi:hypothetical protein
MFIFEELLNKSFELKTMMDFYVYYYSCLLAGKEYDKTFDEFIEDCDNDPDAINWFISELTSSNKIKEQFDNTDSEDSKKK